MAENLISYAQNGEDVVLARALNPDVVRGTWIDVGAGGPVTNSVTKVFSDRGWRGINIEPAVEEFEQLQMARPHDTNLQVAAGATSGVVTFFECEPERPGLSTTSAEIAARYAEDGTPFTPREVPMVTLADVFREYVDGPVDFLKIDAEGAEAEVIKGADFTMCKPRILVVEATLPNSTVEAYEDWEPMLLGAGYHFVMFDGLNRFYLSDDEPELASRLHAPANVMDGFSPYPWVKAFEEQAVAAAELQVVAQAALEELATTHEALSTALQELEVVHEQYARLNEAYMTLDEAHSRLNVGYMQLNVAHTAMAEELGHSEASASAARELAGEVIEQLTIEREQREHVEAELVAMRNSKVFRWTAKPRSVYGRSRRLLGRVRRRLL